MRKYGCPERDMFAVAYNWMFGESTHDAKIAYREAKAQKRQSYIDTVIEGYCRNFKIAFYED